MGRRSQKLKKQGKKFEESLKRKAKENEKIATERVNKGLKRLKPIEKRENGRSWREPQNETNKNKG